MQPNGGKLYTTQSKWNMVIRTMYRFISMLENEINTNNMYSNNGMIAEEPTKILN